MKKNSITAMSTTSAVKNAVNSADIYDPNDPDSVDSFWEGASITDKGKVIGTARKIGQRGTQKKPTKVQVTLRLSPEVLDFFKSSGKGWQTRMNDMLLKHVHTKNHS